MAFLRCRERPVPPYYFPGGDDLLREFSLELTRANWDVREECDLAVALLTDLPSDGLSFKAVDVKFLIEKSTIESERIGPGDDVFLVGRFVNHEGRQKNLPCIRCGNIAMMADKREPVLLSKESKKRHEAFLVELRTKCGFSGSPVFVQLHSPAVDQYRGSIPRLDVSPESGYGPWLLGVHIGQVRDTTETALKSDQTDTGMGIVIPAWHLNDLLGGRRSVDARRDADERFASREMTAPVKLELAM
jgi:hypothetical protein